MSNSPAYPWLYKPRDLWFCIYLHPAKIATLTGGIPHVVLTMPHSPCLGTVGSAACRPYVTKICASGRKGGSRRFTLYHHTTLRSLYTRCLAWAAGGPKNRKLKPLPCLNDGGCQSPLPRRMQSTQRTVVSSRFKSRSTGGKQRRSRSQSIMPGGWSRGRGRS